MQILSKQNLLFLVIGMLLMFIYHVNSVKTNEDNTSKLINNFRDTYETQRGVAESYEVILTKLSYCSFNIEESSCSFDEMLKLAKISSESREDLINQLTELNKETETLISKLPHKTD